MLIVSLTDPPQRLSGDQKGPLADVDQDVGEMLCRREDLWRRASEEESLEFTAKNPKRAPAKKAAAPAPRRRSLKKAVAKKAPAAKAAPAKKS